MDYDAIDRHASKAVVSCVKNGTRFYLTAEGLASDIPSRAKVYRRFSEAESSVADARGSWDSTFEWTALSVLLLQRASLDPKAVPHA